MKVVHILKKIELIDEDIKELKKMEKLITKNKSFSTPIFMSIEKQINILLGERIKLLELKIENPPENLVSEIEYKSPAADQFAEKKPAPPEKKSEKPSDKKPAKPKSKITLSDALLDDDIPMLTQDQIDVKIAAIKTEPKPADKKAAAGHDKNKNDDHVKLLDIALEKGNIDKKEVDKEKDKKVRFFRENFPIE